MSIIQPKIADKCIYIKINQFIAGTSTLENKEMFGNVCLTKVGRWQQSKLLFNNCRKSKQRLFAVLTVTEEDKEITHLGEISNIGFSKDETNVWFSHFWPVLNPIKNSRRELIVSSTKNLLPATWEGNHAICETPGWLVELIDSFT